MDRVVMNRMMVAQAVVPQVVAVTMAQMVMVNRAMP
jgi:hypothetical protein